MRGVVRDVLRSTPGTTTASPGLAVALPVVVVGQAPDSESLWRRWWRWWRRRWCPPDPYAWMEKFGGKAFITPFLKQPGERLKDYYARMGGDPVKTLLQKYQEINGFDADMNMRAMAIGALGLTGIIDPQSLEEVFSMPQSDYLSNLMKAGPSMAGLTRSKGFGGGLRTMKGNDWWCMTNALKNWAPTAAAPTPTTTPV